MSQQQEKFDEFFFVGDVMYLPMKDVSVGEIVGLELHIRTDDSWVLADGREFSTDRWPRLAAMLVKHGNQQEVRPGVMVIPDMRPKPAQAPKYIDRPLRSGHYPRTHHVYTVLVVVLLALFMGYVLGRYPRIKSVDQVLSDVECYGLGLPQLDGHWVPALEVERSVLSRTPWEMALTLRCRAFVLGSVHVFDARQAWIQESSPAR